MGRLSGISNASDFIHGIKNLREQFLDFALFSLEANGNRRGCCNVSRENPDYSCQLCFEPNKMPKETSKVAPLLTHTAAIMSLGHVIVAKLYLSASGAIATLGYSSVKKG